MPDKALIFLLILSLVIGILFIPNHTYTTDGFGYMDVAKNLAEGRGFSHSSFYVDADGNVSRFPLIAWFPLFPFLASIFVRVGLGGIISSKLVNVVFSTLTIIPLFHLTKKIFKMEIAYISCLIVVLFYPFIWNQVHLQTETVYTFFLISALYFLTKKDDRYLLISGIFAGFSYLTRGPGILTIISILTFIVFFKKRSFIQKIKLSFYPVITFVLVSLPWWVRNYLVMGNPLYYSQAKSFSLSLGYIISQLLIFKRIFIDLFPIFVFIPVAIYTMRKDREKLSIILIYPVLHILLFMFWSVFNTRLLSPAYILLVVLSVKGLYDLSVFLQNKFEWRFSSAELDLNSSQIIFLSVAVLFIVLNIFSVYCMYSETRVPNEEISLLLNSGGIEFLKENADEGDVLMLPVSGGMITTHSVSYFTDMNVVKRLLYAKESGLGNLPIKVLFVSFDRYLFGSEEFVQKLDEFNVRYVIIFKNQESEEDIKKLNEVERDHVLNLLENNKDEIPDHFRLVYNSDDSIIYEFSG